MAKGAPDGTKVSLIRSDQSTGDMFGAQTGIDLAELTARLDGDMIYDRRGQILWRDGFEATNLHWLVDISVGSSAARNTSYAFRQEASCKMTSGAGAADFVSIMRGLPYISDDRMGLQCSFSFDSAWSKGVLHLEQNLQDRNGWAQALLEYNPATGIIQIWDAGAGAYVTVASNIQATLLPEYWNTLKFVVDFNTRKYVRLLFQSESYDISAYSLNFTPGVYTMHYEPLLSVQNKAGATASNIAYLDDVVVTVNEP